MHVGETDPWERTRSMTPAQDAVLPSLRPRISGTPRAPSSLGRWRILHRSSRDQTTNSGGNRISRYGHPLQEDANRTVLLTMAPDELAARFKIHSIRLDSHGELSWEFTHYKAHTC